MRNIYILWLQVFVPCVANIFPLSVLSVNSSVSFSTDDISHGINESLISFFVAKLIFQKHFFSSKNFYFVPTCLDLYLRCILHFGSKTAQGILNEVI